MTVGGLGSKEKKGPLQFANHIAIVFLFSA